MNKSFDQPDYNRLTKYIGSSSPKYKPNTNIISNAFQRFANLQEVRFSEIQKGCTDLENYMASIQEMLQKIQQRLQEINEIRSTETIFNLKNKQNEFIIHELKQKMKKFEKNEQNAEIQIRYLKKQLQTIKRNEKQRQKTDSIKSRQELVSMQQKMKQKDIIIEELNDKIKKMNELKKEEKRQSVTSSEKMKKQKQQEYKVLQTKLLQLEKDFEGKVTSLQQELRQKKRSLFELEQDLDRKQKQFQYKSNQYQNKIKELQFKNKQMEVRLRSFEQYSNDTSPNEELPLSMTATFNPRQSFSSQQSTQSASMYELQLKLTHQQTLYKQLQQQYSSHLTLSSTTQIQLHQQIHQQKFLIQQQRKKYKAEKKKAIQILQGLMSFINRRSFNYFDWTHDIEQIVQQVKKVYNKQKDKWEKELSENKKIEDEQKDKITELQRQLRKLKLQNQSLKQQLQLAKQHVQRLVVEKKKEKKKKFKRENSSQMTESNNPKNSSFTASLGDISNPKSEASSILEEKYKSMIDSLRLQIQQKQQHILDLQTLQSVDFQKSKQKILAIESQLADSRNQTKKLQRQLREIKQKSTEQSKQSESLRASLQQARQKFTKQKQAVQRQFQQKTKTQQEKLIKLKQQNQQIDSKCQQKVMKYNKLKSKLEKLQLYSNETEKRKDGQIEELIKKNQQLKIDCKLLEQKLRIAQTLQLGTNPTQEGQNTVKTAFGYNKQLIQQIQMQRDRILQQYESKRRQYIKLKQQNDKAQEQRQLFYDQKQKLQSQKQKIQHEKILIQQEKQRISLESTKMLAKLQEEKMAINSDLFEVNKELARYKQLKEALEKEIAKLQQDISAKSKHEYQHLKKQLETQFQARRKLQKQQQALVQRIKQLKEINEKLKNENKQKIKSIENKSLQKIKEKSNHYHSELSKVKDQYSRKLKDLEQKISEAAIREENLVNIINYKNMSVGGTVRESMKGEQDQGYQEVKKYELNENKLPVDEVNQYEFVVSSPKKQTQHQEVNTIDPRDFFEIYETSSFKISPTRSSFNLSIQKQPVISIKKQKQYIDANSSANIFEQQRQLFSFMEQKYPHALDYIVRQGQSKQQQKNDLNGPIQLDRINAGVNTENAQKSSLKGSLLKVKDDMNSGQALNKKTQENRITSSINILTSTLKQSRFLEQNQHQFQENLSRSSVQQTPITDLDFISIHPHNPTKQKFNPQQNKIQQINLFQNLQPSNLKLDLDEQNIDDNFQICEEGESINVGQTALNLQIKEIFNKLREQLEKVFNGEEISLSMIKILPRQLEDDYNQFISYVKEKIQEIKNQNQLSFIMAEVGDSPSSIEEDLDMQLKNFIEKKVSEDVFAYKKLIEEKQALITSLMNQKTLQQNTINQMTMEQQQIQEEHENRFMNQCNIYKKEIKQLKNKVDRLEMNFQSLKNVFKNTMEIWVDEYENEDDLRDNFAIYKSVAKLNELQSTRLNYYIFRYKEIKNISD